MDPAHRRDLLRITRNHALEAAYKAQKLLDEDADGYPVSDEDARFLAAQAMRHKDTVEMVWASRPWWRRAWDRVASLWR